jgi:hypothetical protein
VQPSGDGSRRLVCAGTAVQPDAIQTRAAVKAARRRFEGALFLAKSNVGKYGRLVQELATDFNKGRDSYPASLTAAYKLMLHDVRDQDERPQEQGVPGMAFSTLGRAGGEPPGGGNPTGGGGGARIMASTSQPNPRPDVRCNKCGKYGHFMDKCLEVLHASGTTLVVVTDASEMSRVTGTEGGSGSGGEAALVTFGATDEVVEGFQFLNNGATDTVELSLDTKLLSQHKAATGQVVPQSWILLDNQSTVGVFSNRDLLVNIQKATNVCKISCNAGVVTTDLIGDLPGYPAPVWFHQHGIANILSLYRVGLHCRVQYDNERHGGGIPCDEA